MSWTSLEKVRALSMYRGRTRDNGKVATYDYKTRKADVIPHSQAAFPVSTVEMIADPFGVQNVLRQLRNGERHAVLLAGNSGLPAGAVGLEMMVKSSITNADSLFKRQYGTQEEDVVKNWLLTEYIRASVPIAENLALIWDEYGMADYNAHDARTKQGVNYKNLKDSRSDLINHLGNAPYAKLYAEAHVVRRAWLSPKTFRKPDEYDFSEAVETTLVFVSGPNVGARGSGDPRSTTLRTFNSYLANNYPDFREAVKWTYYAALHAMAMENCKVAVLCWVSGDLYAGPFKDTYGVQSDGQELTSILEEVLNMRCFFQTSAQPSQLKYAFSRVIVVSLGTGAQSLSTDVASSSVSDIRANAKKLASCYNKQTLTFPRWCLDETYLSTHDEYAKSTIVFYDGEDTRRMSDVQRVVAQREPVNIAMSIGHDAQCLNKNFGYTRSYYREYFEKHKRLAPNVAIYCETPFMAYDPHNQTTKWDKNKARIRVLNVIGYGFDSHEQPDHKYFGEDPSLLRAHMKLIFDKILACIKTFESSQPIKYMHLPGFGTGAFAGDNPHVKDIFEELKTQFIPMFEKQGVVVDTNNIFQYGTFSQNTLQLHRTWEEHNQKNISLESRLYINAWDPHSIIGNGNFEDASLDGYYGRSTALALLGWPKTNPHMTYVATKVRHMF